MSKEKLTKKNDSCSCQCDCQTISDPSRRNFIKQATTLTIIGGSAFILEACGGGGSSPTSSDDGTGGGDTGGGSGGNGNGGGDTGYNYDATTGIITIDISKIHTTLQTVGTGIALAPSITFDDRGIIVLRTSTQSVKALSRRCTHQGNTVNIDSTNNNLLCPSHGSVFDFNGNVVSGPATSSLTQYSASLSGTMITITAA